MPGRRKDLRPKSGADAPSSGNYNPNYDPMRKSGPLFSITKSKRDNIGLFSNTPGSGAYFVNDDLAKTHSATWRIGSERRPGQQ